MSGNIGHDGRHGLAGQRLFCSPEQFDYIGCPNQDQSSRIKPEAPQSGAIGQAQFLAFPNQLQVNDRRTLRVQQATGLRQRKPQQGARMATLIGEDLLQESIRREREAIDLIADHCPCLGQRRFALDIGNGVAQRGDALLAFGRGHRAIPCEQNRNI